MATKYIFVTGGVVSGLGKGITAASLGRLLKQRGHKVSVQKLDPYLNFDPGTMNPFQHGEVFVTEDGAETDLDLGHYERFIDENLNNNCNLTSGRVYFSVISKERSGDYQGNTVQVIPHITNEIKQHIAAGGKDSDVAIVEIGGTVGDIESQPYIEAIRQFAFDIGKENCMFIHVTLVPFLNSSHEHKTKPTQHSVKQLLSFGIQPDVIVCRTEKKMENGLKNKIALFCNVSNDSVIENCDLKLLYEVPLMLEEEGLADVTLKRLGLPKTEPDLTEWTGMVHRMKNLSSSVKIAIVGKYVGLHDAYISVAESLKHAGAENALAVDIKWIDSENIDDDNVAEVLGDCNGILVPGGFGSRGIDGKIAACKFARTNGIPYFGICLGMQIALIEFARNVIGFHDAHSSEIDPSSTHPVIDLMPEQTSVTQMGGTMRLGRYPCVLDDSSKAIQLYGKKEISERHRHRYEVNNVYREEFTENGMFLAGISPDKRIVEVIELPEHPWFIACQFHPEFKSRPNRSHPLFFGFVRAAGQQKNQ
ncbi:MAG: CTP synthase [Clostridiales bacterium 43-6]|nr:MAG: CTP synthase [Clostridiales bacterium 43-6]